MLADQSRLSLWAIEKPAFVILVTWHALACIDRCAHVWHVLCRYSYHALLCARLAIVLRFILRRLGGFVWLQIDSFEFRELLARSSCSRPL